MMGWGWPMMSGYGAVFMVLGTCLALGALVVGVIVLATASTQPWHPTGTARRVLDERYARGEIDDDEYHRRAGVIGH